MKRIVAILAIFFLLSVTLLPSANAASSGTYDWSITPSQEFAIANGETITFKVNGMPGAYSLINVVDPSKHNATIENGMVFLNDAGAGKWNWSVPITQASGKFNVIVSMDGVNMTSTQIEIVYDRVSYLQYTVDKQTAELERQRQMVINYGQVVAEVKSLQFTMAIACVIVAVWFTTIALTLWWRRTEFLEFLRLQNSNKRGRMRALASKIYLVTHPPVDGMMTLTLAGLDKQIESRLRRNKRGAELPKAGAYVVEYTPEGAKMTPIQPTPGEEVVDERDERKFDIIAEPVKEERPEPIGKAPKVKHHRLSFLSSLFAFGKHEKKRSVRPEPFEGEEYDDAPKEATSVVPKALPVNEIAPAVVEEDVWSPPAPKQKEPDVVPKEERPKVKRTRPKKVKDVKEVSK